MIMDLILNSHMLLENGMRCRSCLRDNQRTVAFFSAASSLDKPEVIRLCSDCTVDLANEIAFGASP